MAAPRADHAQRGSVARRQVLQRRQDLAARKVARGAEDHEIDLSAHSIEIVETNPLVREGAPHELAAKPQSSWGLMTSVLAISSCSARRRIAARGRATNRRAAWLSDGREPSTDTTRCRMIAPPTVKPDTAQPAM